MRPRADTLLVWTGAECINGCGACPIDRTTAPGGVTVADLQPAALPPPACDSTLAVLVGGEPLLRADLARLAAVLRARGYVPGLVTTGRPLVYPQIRERLRRIGTGYLRVQLFGVSATHDQATAVAGGFEQAIAGLRAWADEPGGGCDVDVVLTIRARPLAAIAAEVEALANLVAVPAVQLVVAIDPILQKADRDGLRAALAALAGWNDAADRPLLAWEGLTDAPPRTWVIPPLAPAFTAPTPRASCLGAIGSGADWSGDAAEATHANSFNFVRTAASVPWTAAAEACTAYASGRGDASRTLWLVEGDRLAEYATDTGDFAPADVARIKDELSHLFLDRAPAGVLDDFTNGMRRVVPDVVCAACANRERCGHRYVVIEGPPFAREEAWIAAHVAGLRGRVLDVGCGEQLYRDAIAPLLRSGAVQYTGLDPDEPSLASARAALPEGRFWLGGIEEYRGGAERYDHILCLRSLNHVLDLDLAIARMAELLAPGGALLIVETTPFAMLRRAEQVAAADRAPRAGHQHFRNVAGEEVIPYARRRGLYVVDHHAASRENTNEWILLLRRS